MENCSKKVLKSPRSCSKPSNNISMAQPITGNYRPKVLELVNIDMHNGFSTHLQREPIGTLNTTTNTAMKTVRLNASPTSTNVSMTVPALNDVSQPEGRHHRQIPSLLEDLVPCTASRSLEHLAIHTLERKPKHTNCLKIDELAVSPSLLPQKKLNCTNAIVQTWRRPLQTDEPSAMISADMLSWKDSTKQTITSRVHSFHTYCPESKVREKATLQRLKW